MVAYTLEGPVRSQSCQSRFLQPKANFEVVCEIYKIGTLLHPLNTKVAVNRSDGAFRSMPVNGPFVLYKIVFFRESVSLFPFLDMSRQNVH